MLEKQLEMRENVSERLFDADSYIQCFSAKVVSCVSDGENGWYAVLDRTAFFPEGGGQSGDRGFLNEVRVLDTVEKDGVICHRIGEALAAGTTVQGQIDFSERFDKMQQHTGEHILSGIVSRLYGYHNIGFHLGAESTTLDFDGELSAEQVKETEELVNRAVFDDLPVKVIYPEREELPKLSYRSKIEIEGRVRLVEIEGTDLCACCAPHVRRTGEVGLVKILSCERHRGGCRLTIVCGGRALADYRQKQKITGQVSVCLSAKPEKITEALKHLRGQQQKLREQLNRVQALYLQEKLANVSAEDRFVCIFEEGLDPAAVRNFVNAAMEKCSGICGAFNGSGGDGYHYILGSSTVDVRGTAKALNERFSGKGGGKPQMVQGSVRGSEEEIRRFLENTGGKEDDLSKY